MKKMFSKIKKFKFLICSLLGIILGLILKKDAVILKPIGTTFVNLIFVAVIPLVFFSITSTISKYLEHKKIKNIFLKFIVTMFLTLSITGIFTIVVCLLVNPFKNVSIILESYEVEKINIFEQIMSMFTVNDFSLLLSKSNILPLVIFSILIGFSVRSIDKNNKISIFFENGYNVVNSYLQIVLKFVPIGIIAYLSAIVGEYSNYFIKEYVSIIVMYLVIGVLNILIFHTLYLFISGGFKKIKIYYKNIFELFSIAFSTQSSVVTMPTNIKVLDKLGVSKMVNSVCTPIATLINMQGNVIQNTLKILLVCSLCSIPINGIGSYIIFILVSMLAGMLTAGIPGGGVISNTILVSILSLPVDVLPILITIEWILDAPATVFNILSDTSVLPLVDKFVGTKNDN